MAQLFNTRTYSVCNDGGRRLEVWLQPWGKQYVVPSDSRLIVSYVAGYDTELLESRAENDLLELRFSGKQPPCVQIETPLIQTLSGKIIRCKARY